MLAVVPVRGELPSGAAETVAEAGGRVLLVGRGTVDAAKELIGIAVEIRAAEVGEYRPAAWAAALIGVLEPEPVVVLPGSPDGRDLAPRLAYALSRPLVSGAFRVTAGEASIVRHGGRAERSVTIDGPVVLTFAPGSRTVSVGSFESDVEPIELALDAAVDGDLVEELPADPTTMDLVEARRIVGGGAGLGTVDAFAELGRVGAKVGASLGATRVVTDAGWAPHERQIGTTGVEVDPDLYLAFGISGAVQHVMGLGNPDHVISVNTDAACPMMAMADLAVVADAAAVVTELALLLEVGP